MSHRTKFKIQRALGLEPLGLDACGRGLFGGDALGLDALGLDTLGLDAGGFGFLGGPCETQIETDRRLIGERLAKLRREIEGVKRTRGLQRRARRRVPFPVIALVGYTNAGKSTLFNKLTDAGVFAKDVLFATLDPTMRGLKLPNGTKAILSDTVGYIADLPHELVAAFRATLEEVLEADLIVHVRDAAHPESEAQKGDVLKVLSELGIELGVDRPFLEVLNKVDLLEPEVADALLAGPHNPGQPIAISAKTGEGLAKLLARFETDLSNANIHFQLVLDAADGAGQAWVYRHGQVLEKTFNDDATVTLSLSTSPAELEKFEHRFGAKMLAGQGDSEES